MAGGGITIDLKFDKRAVCAKIDLTMEKGIEAIANEALKDCDEFVPSAEGTLAASGIKHSNPKKGILRWVTPYARYDYYGVTKSGKPLRFRGDGTPPHPQAQKMWAHLGWALYKSKYKRMMDQIAKGWRR